MNKNLYATTDKKPPIYPVDKSELSEEFILTTHIEIISENKYEPRKKPLRMYEQTGELVEGKTENDLYISFSNSEMEEILAITKSTPKPKPLKIYNDVFVGGLPHSEKNPDVREIRFQLINQPYVKIVKLNKKDYYVFVDQYAHGDEDLNDYYLYNPKEYYLYRDCLKAQFMELCKKWNDKEFENLLIRIEEVNNNVKKFQSNNYLNILKYLGDVKQTFEKWYKETSINTPLVNLTFEKQPKRNMKKRSAEIFLELVKEGKAKSVYDNPKEISDLAISRLEKEMILTYLNKKAIYDYFRGHFFTIRTDPKTKEKSVHIQKK